MRQHPRSRATAAHPGARRAPIGDRPRTDAGKQWRRRGNGERTEGGEARTRRWTPRAAPFSLLGVHGTVTGDEASPPSTSNHTIGIQPLQASRQPDVATSPRAAIRSPRSAGAYEPLAILAGPGPWDERSYSTRRTSLWQWSLRGGQ